MNIQAPPFNPPAPGTPGLRLPNALAFAARLASILAPLLALLNRYAPALGPVHMPLHARIVRAGQRLARLLARLAAGTFRPATPRPAAKGGPPATYLPHSRAWIVQKLGHHAAAYMSQLQCLIDAPETRALLAAAPPEALRPLGRTLRPLARLLGVDLPPCMRLPPRPPRIRPPRPTPPIQLPEPPSPHTLWRRAHRRGLPPPLYPSLHAPQRRQARI